MDRNLDFSGHGAIIMALVINKSTPQGSQVSALANLKIFVLCSRFYFFNYELFRFQLVSVQILEYMFVVGL